MNTIKSKEQLQAMLQSQGINYNNWGKGTSKSLDNLWEEIEGGETSIQDNPFLRVVEVVQVLIYKEGKMLIEYEQEFKDGRKRLRNKPPSEKMKPGENYIEAAVRCLVEELEMEKEDITIFKDSYSKKITTINSPSYPELKTRYILHTVNGKVTGLPNDEFWTSETSHNETDAISRHHWIWSKDF